MEPNDVGSVTPSVGVTRVVPLTDSKRVDVATDKAANMAKEIKGTANVVVGAVTGDDDLKAEGHADKAKGNPPAGRRERQDTYKR